MITCHMCGVVNEENAKFCKGCGTDLKKIKKIKKPAETADKVATSEETELLKNRISRLEDEHENILSKRLDKFKKSLEGKVNECKGNLNELDEKISEKVKELDRLDDYIKGRMKAVEKEIEKKGSELDSDLRSIDKRIREIEGMGERLVSKLKEIEKEQEAKVTDFGGKIESSLGYNLRERVREVSKEFDSKLKSIEKDHKQALKDFAEIIVEEKSKELKLNFEGINNELEKLRGEIEAKRRVLGSQVKKVEGMEERVASRLEEIETEQEGKLKEFCEKIKESVLEDFKGKGKKAMLGISKNDVERIRDLVESDIKPRLSELEQKIERLTSKPSEIESEGKEKLKEKEGKALIEILR